jgi:glycerol-3-phosphate dehydrogenase (NAD(P)+)
MADAGKQVAVLGAGAWGTALAVALGVRDTTLLWARDRTQAETMARARRNERYLPEVAFPEGLAVVGDFATAVAGADLLLLASPVAGLRDLLTRLATLELAATPGLVWLCKGFEQGSGRLPHQIVAERCRGPRSRSRSPGACPVRSRSPRAMPLSRGGPLHGCTAAGSACTTATI